MKSNLKLYTILLTIIFIVGMTLIPSINGVTTIENIPDLKTENIDSYSPEDMSGIARNYETTPDDKPLSLSQTDEEWQESETVRIDYLGKNNTVKEITANVNWFGFDREIIRLLGNQEHPYDVMDLTTDGDGNLYIIGVQMDKLYKYSPDGEWIWTIGSSGSGTSQFDRPQGITYSWDDNQIIVSDTDNDRMQVFETDGTFVREFGTTGSGIGNFDSPRGISWNPTNNRLYIVDLNNDRIKIMSIDGGYFDDFGSAGTGDGQFSTAVQVAVDTSGDIFIVDYTADRVQRFSSTGTYETQWGTTGAGKDNLNYPYSIDVDTRTGYVYVMDVVNERVQVFDTDGVYKFEWGSIGEGTGTFYHDFIFDDSLPLHIDGQWSGGSYAIYTEGFDFLQKWTNQTAIPDFTGQFPSQPDDSLEYHISQQTTGLIAQQEIEIDFLFFDVANPTEVGLKFSWETIERVDTCAGCSSFSQEDIFLDEQFTLSLSDNAVYSSSELRMTLTLVFNEDHGFSATITAFDTGLNQFVTSTIENTGVSEKGDEFAFWDIKLDYVWAESQEIQSNVRSDLKYNSPFQLSHKLKISVFDYRIPLSIYSPLGWNFSSITPNANVVWDDTNQYWYITDTLPLVYELIFISGTGYGIGTPSTKMEMSIIDVSGIYGLDGFESGNNTWLQSTTNSWDSGKLNTTKSSEGLSSLRLIDTDSGIDDLELTIPTSSSFYLVFDYYIESWSSGDLQLRWYSAYDGGWFTDTLDTTSLNRWVRVFTQINITGDILGAFPLQIRRTAVSGSAIIFIDNIRFYQTNTFVQTDETGVYSIYGYMSSWDGYSDVAIPYLNLYLKLIIPSSTTIVKEWNATTDLDGIYHISYSGDLSDQDYLIEVYGFNNFTTAPVPSYTFSPLKASLILIDPDYQYNFDTQDYLYLSTSDVTGTYDTTTTIADITGSASKYGLLESSTNLAYSGGSYSVSARMRQTGGTDTYFGLFFYDTSTGGANFDDYVLVRTGSAQTVFRVDGVETNPIYVTSSNTWYNFRVDVTETYVKWYLDDTLVQTRINTNPLTLPRWGVVVYEAQIEIDYFRLTAMAEPQIFDTETQTMMTSLDNSLVYDIYLDGINIGEYEDEWLIPLDMTNGIHNLTIVPARNLLFPYEPYLPDIAGKLEFIYDTSVNFSVSVYSFSVSSNLISTYITANRNGNYTAYENDIPIGTGDFIGSGTSIQTNRDQTEGVLILYSILFQNQSDTLWFNTSYSNALVVIPEFQVTIGSYHVSTLVISTYVTSNRNGTYEVFENDTSIDSGDLFGVGMSILTPRNVTEGIIYYSVKFINGSSTLWFNATYSNVDLVIGGFQVDIGSFFVSETIVSTYMVSNRNGTWEVFENDTSIDTGAFTVFGTSIQTNRNLTEGRLIYYSLKFTNDSNVLWFNTTYSNADLVIADYLVTIQNFLVQDVIITTFITANRDGTYEIFENDTLIGVSSPYVTTGTSIQSDRDTTQGSFVFYAIKFTDSLSNVLWFNTTYSNALLPDPVYDVHISLVDGLGIGLGFETFPVYANISTKLIRLPQDFLWDNHENISLIVKDYFNVTLYTGNYSLIDDEINFIDISVPVYDLILGNQYQIGVRLVMARAGIVFQVVIPANTSLGVRITVGEYLLTYVPIYDHPNFTDVFIGNEPPRQYGSYQEGYNHSTLAHRTIFLEPLIKMNVESQDKAFNLMNRILNNKYVKAFTVSAGIIGAVLLVRKYASRVWKKGLKKGTTDFLDDSDSGKI